MILREAFAEAVIRLRAAGVPDASDSTRLILNHHVSEALGTMPTPDADLPDADGFFAAVAARAERRPMSHILGGRAFWKHWFRVTPDVLDPRPDTETLVEAALDRPFDRVLDLGTGSGCILLSLLAERPDATGVGVDVSPATLEVARENAAALGLADRAEMRAGDWFEGVSGRFDLIVSNPPYLAEAEMATLAPEVRLWEPRVALTPGGDGLAAYRVIAAGAASHLVSGGRLIVEIGAGQAAAVGAILREAGWAGIAVLPDIDGRDRACVAFAERKT